MVYLAVLGAIVFSVGVILLIVVYWKSSFGPYLGNQDLIDAILGSAALIFAGMASMFWGILGRMLQMGFFGPGG